MLHISAGVLPLLLALTPSVPMSPAPPDQSDFSLTVTPSRMVVPADEIGHPRRFTVTNRGRTAIDVSMRTASFLVDTKGDLIFQSDAPHTAIDWVTVRPERLRLAAQSATPVDVRIAVPSTAEPGEHQVAVIFSTSPPAGAPGLSVRRSVGAPVYVTVPGEAVDSVQVAKLGVPGFATRGPLALTATVRNVGTLHRDFVAADRLRAQVAGEDVTFGDFTLLRDASRQVSARWDDPPLACVCRVTVAVSNPDGSPGSAMATVVILPMHLIGPGLGGVLLLLLLAWVLRRRRSQAGVPAEGESPADAGDRHALAAWFPDDRDR
ncbi:hypothetical protein V6V47_20410 [Micromonospora sp. CPCC 205539]|uniref:hypothetical protein n=1 Tax=Micromonospora sp. CPCC 205539 TaxID=3122408 RepID=UPI002FF326FF